MQRYKDREIPWECSRFGRDVVTNLTTVSDSVRGFTVALLARYYTQRLIDEDRIDEEDAIPLFLRMEQIAAYSRYVGRSESDRDRILGVTRVSRFLDEHGGKVPIENSAVGFILSDQKTYGLWGLFSVSARVSGLLADGPVGLTDWAWDFVERTYVPRLRKQESKLIKLILRGGKLDAHKGRQPFQAVADVMQSTFTDAELGFYRAALRDAERIDRPSAPLRQKQLAELILKQLTRDAPIGRDDVANLEITAGRSNMNGLANKLQRILRLEALLAPAEALFELIQARNGQTPASLAAHVADQWGARVPHLDDPIAELMSEIRIAVGHEQAQALMQCDAALACGDYEDAIEALLDLNRLVMDARGAAPWVKINAGEFDVQYRGAEQDFPDGDELARLWRNSYFIDTLKTITFELEQSH